jgi:hypothetical protein
MLFQTLLCGVLRKRLHLKACKVSIVQGIKCQRFRNTRHTVTFETPL